MKETFYFSHDYHARGDEKIVKLISKEGWKGYGLFWAIVEKLYEADGWIEQDYESLSYDMRTDSECIIRIIEDYGLFKFASKKIYSDSVLARLRVRKGKSERARQSANFRWNKQNKDDANALRTQSERNANKVKESKVKESKVKESKVKESKVNYIEVGRFTPPTLEEVKAYCQERLNNIDPEQFISYYESNGWLVGKNKMKSWQAAVRTWEKRNKPNKPLYENITI